MIKVLVTGAAGQVGSELTKFSPSNFEVLALDSTMLDITDYYKVQQIVLQYKPELIINSAAYTAVDKAESDVDQAFLVNEFGVKNLSEAAHKLKIPIFHISTDYVFDGASQKPYKEDDPVNPTSVYGASKLAGELALINADIPYIILRTSWVFGLTGNNFVKTMLRLGKERDTLAVVADQYGCPTSSESIAAALWQLAKQYAKEGTLPWGTYHFCNGPACTWYDFACEIFKQATDAKIILSTPILNAIPTDAYPTPAMRPARSVLDCSKAESLLYSALPNWRVELSTMLKKLQD